MSPYCVISFYKFVNIEDTDVLRANLLNFCNHNRIKGTILLAEEGLNSTLAGSEESIQKFCAYLRSYDIFFDINFKRSTSTVPPFKKMKVKIKKEIVTFGVESLDISQRGEYLDSKTWDEVIKQDDTILIDTRNYYEYAMGTFKGAINPRIHNFTELVKWLNTHLTERDKKKKIAMFCTGGIRCEKSTAYLKQHGFENVYHLKDGIIKYIEDNRGNPASSWNGECFIFDDRVTY
ncbi:oxygen-dependent tRNA uridine(34) hydroxylase TrhO [Candidatus Bandiella euplotis]|uniref:tRNA uridine(34) hydroxylase n=1 Tax=Candidatus Bandiella euplotis TaxID=1664265 RepID=A0ABZ0UPX6_9RICK|nr:rhodanese-like domain-containing protein [Candidatus Bandiella woodruffii]WPX96945.1 Rhodanese-related sulfurtransferase domain protein [Candidatus Bandiella woodruffii]